MAQVSAAGNMPVAQLRKHMACLFGSSATAHSPTSSQDDKKGQVKGEKPLLHKYPECPLGTQLYTHIGLDALRRNGIHALNENTLLMAAGNLVFFVDYRTGKIRDSLLGPDGGGVGAVAVHPDRTSFVVCEKKKEYPEIVIYNFPEREKIHVMKKGAKIGFSACTYNLKGNLLATVAMEPDYMLTLWDWKHETIVLRNKAFGSDIFSIFFSPFSETLLVTSGMGHIKFWTIADTFTGCKLQGATGKFGKIEISDISACAYFPDGKVLSGSEHGDLLLWQGNLIKCQIAREVAVDGRKARVERNLSKEFSYEDAQQQLQQQKKSVSGKGRESTVSGKGGGIISAKFGGKGRGVDFSESFLDASMKPFDGEDKKSQSLTQKGSANDDPLQRGSMTAMLRDKDGKNSWRESNVKKNVPCHEGPIDVVLLIENSKVVMTVGNDGYVRYWPMQAIDLAEIDNHSLIVGVPCLKELFLGTRVKGRSICLSVDQKEWILLDANGSILLFPHWNYEQLTDPFFRSEIESPLRSVMTFFGGPIISCALSSTDHTAVFGGADGTIRQYAYLTKTELFRSRFDAAVISIEFLPSQQIEISSKNERSNSLMICGFDNGIIRYIKRERDGFQVIAAWRPHNAHLCGVAIDLQTRHLYTVGQDGTAFYFRIRQHYKGEQDDITPVGFCTLPVATAENFNGNPILMDTSAGTPMVTCLEWTGDSTACLLGFENGNILGIFPPEKGGGGELELERLGGDYSEEGYEFPVRYFGVGVRQKKLRPKKEKKKDEGSPLIGIEAERSSSEDEEEEDQGPWRVNFIRRFPLDTERRYSHLNAIDMTKCEYIIGFDRPELCYKYNCNIRYESKLGPPPIPLTGIDPPGRIEDPQENLCYCDCVPINAFFSNDCKKIIVCCENNVILVRDLAFLTEETNFYRARQYHDCIEGHLNGAGISYDGSCLVSIADDGLIIVQRIKGVPLPGAKEEQSALIAYQQQPQLVEIPPGTMENLPSISHSIPQQKVIDNRLKAEELAEGKRNYLLRKISQVHKDYEVVFKENARVDGGKQLSGKELVLDPELDELLMTEQEKKVLEAKVDYEWRLEYMDQKIKQLRNSLLDCLEYDLFCVKSFNGDFSVSSLRAPALTVDIKEKQQQLQYPQSASKGIPSLGLPFLELDSSSSDEETENIVSLFQEKGGSPVCAKGSSPRDRTKSSPSGLDNPVAELFRNVSGVEDSQTEAGRTSGRATRDSQKDFELSHMLSKIIGTKLQLKGQLEKADLRKKERNELKAEQEALNRRKLKPTDRNTADMATINDTRKNKGDHPLKSAPEFRLPENLIPTADRKAKQLTVLLCAIHDLQVEFNGRLLAFRDLKHNLCEELSQERNRVIEIVTVLGSDPTEIPGSFELSAEEKPENRFAIDADGLRKYIHKKEKSAKLLAAQARAMKGFGADLAQADSDEEDRGPKVNGTDTHQRSVVKGGGVPRAQVGGTNFLQGTTSTTSARGTIVKVAAIKQFMGAGGGLTANRASMSPLRKIQIVQNERMEMELKARLQNTRFSEIEEEELSILQDQLSYEMQVILSRIRSTTKQFDDKLRELNLEKILLVSDLEMAQMRALLLLREYRMLTIFQENDNVLLARLREAQKKQKTVNQRIKSLKKQIDETRHQQNANTANFAAVLEEADCFIVDFIVPAEQAYLRKVFTRKIKHRRGHDGEEEDDDDEAPTSEDEDENSDDEFKEERPEDVEEDAWERVLALRERRLDCEDEKIAIKQKTEKLAVELQNVTKVDEETQARCKTIVREIEDFQLEKQRRLDLLDTMVTLKLSQVQCLTTPNNKMPRKFSGTELVFTVKGMQRLRQRIVQLAKDKRNFRIQARGLHAQKMDVHRKRSKAQLEKSEWESKVTEVMLLKFGQVVDLEAIEELAVDRETEELKEFLKVEEIKLQKDLRKIQGKVLGLQMDQEQRYCENTMLLKDMVGLKKMQQALEKVLNNSHKRILRVYHAREATTSSQDRARMRKVIISQQDELDCLQAEIQMLRHKGGHLYIPSPTCYIPSSVSSSSPPAQNHQPNDNTATVASVASSPQTSYPYTTDSSRGLHAITEEDSMLSPYDSLVQGGT